MVVPIGIAMTTTVIEEPRHSLLAMPGKGIKALIGFYQVVN